MSESELATDIPHSARVWNYRLGGKDNFEVDRPVGDQFADFYPTCRTRPRSSRRRAAPRST
ncbi:SAM-dependent methyltransferase [Actinoplanes sp. NPDC051411]|uniref:SAM-dependent methyltransferase n=1 Tax=Actinoplanes sp. NPDC051411 TaxID=3155522 RepID=UPI003432E175